jgi:hypothetical protein
MRVTLTEIDSLYQTRTADGLDTLRAKAVAP